MTPLLSPMNTQRRAGIRAMLVAHAGTHHEQTSTQMHPLGTSPAVPAWLRPKVRRTGLSVISAAVVAITASVLLTTDPAAPPSYASWSAVPQPVPDASASRQDIETWASKCSDLGVGGVGIQGVPARREAAARRDVLVDRRGDFTYCVDVSVGNGTATDPLIALSGIKADKNERMANMWTTVFDKPFQQPTAGEILVLGGNLETPPAEPNTAPDPLNTYQLYGMAGTEVTGVDIILANGLRVTATVRGGIWGAWWPAAKGEPGQSTLETHTAAGTQTVAPATVQLPHG